MNPIVEMRDVHVRFRGERTVHALNGVDITLQQGEVLGLLGENPVRARASRCAR